MEKNKKLLNISLLRLFAIISIICFHFLLSKSAVLANNYFPFYFGVSIFLFISGYLY